MYVCIEQSSAKGMCLNILIKKTPHKEGLLFTKSTGACMIYFGNLYMCLFSPRGFVIRDGKSIDVDDGHVIYKSVCRQCYDR